MVDDAQLLQRYLDERSQAAFAELVQRHLNLVYFAALRQSGDPHTAQDVTQNVFLKLALKARSLSGRPTLAGWLFKTTRFEAAHAARTERRRLVRETKAQAMTEILETSDPEANWGRLRPEIDGVLHSLNDKEREAVLLRYFQGISFRLMGERLGLTEDAARFRTDRALKKMRQLLVKRGIDSTVSALALALAVPAEAAAPASLLGSVLGSVAQGVAIPAGPAVQVLQLMSMTKMAVAISTVVCLSMVGLALREHSSVIQTEKLQSVTNQDYQWNLSGLQDLRKQLRQEQDTVAGLRQEVAKLAASEAEEAHAHVNFAGKKTGPAGRSRRGGPHAVDPKLLQDPAYREALTSLAEANMSVLMRPIFKALNLSPEQRETFESVVAEMANPSLRPDNVTQADLKGQLQDLLGAEGFEQATAIYQTQYMRPIASALAGNLYYTDSPLTSQQADQLAQDLASTTQLTGPTTTVNWQAAMPLAQGILNPTQFAAFQNEATILGGQPGPWAGLDPVTAGAYASGRYAPASNLPVRN